MKISTFSKNMSIPTLDSSNCNKVIGNKIKTLGMYLNCKIDTQLTLNCT